MRPLVRVVAFNFLGILASFDIIVVNLYRENYHRATAGDNVCDHQRIISPKPPVNDKEYRTESHHGKCHDRYSVSVAGSDCHYGLRQIAEHHANACKIAYDVSNT